MDTSEKTVTYEKTATLGPLTAKELNALEMALIRYHEHALGGKERGRVARLLEMVAATTREVEGTPR